jgi:RNA polymerase sigma-70 factor (ECF subfamily)
MELIPDADFANQTLPHLDKAYRLARHLTRNHHDAMDVMQEAYLRALRFYRGFRGGDARPWLLEIVRNVFYTSVRQNQLREARAFIEPRLAGMIASQHDPEAELVDRTQKRLLLHSIKKLPDRYREVLLLREFEALPYKEISRILEIPQGTLMSRLSRARKQLRECVLETFETQNQAGNTCSTSTTSSKRT